MTQRADGIYDTEKSELCAVAEMEKVCFGDPWTEKQLAESLEYPFVVMKTAYVQGVPAGYLCATYIAGEAEIQRIAVVPAYRRRGLAEALLDSFFAEKAPEATFLDVRESNTAARALYEKKGFTVCGLRKGYYEHPAEDAVLMRKLPE